MKMMVINQVENSDCASWFYIKWWSLTDSSSPKKTGPIHGRMKDKLVLQRNVDKDELVVQVSFVFSLDSFFGCHCCLVMNHDEKVVAVKDETDDRGSFIKEEVFSAEVPVLRPRGLHLDSHHSKFHWNPSPISTCSLTSVTSPC